MTPNTPAGGAVGCRYRFRVERPDGSGSEWTGWRFAINRQEADYGIPTGRPHEIENLVSADAVLALVGKWRSEASKHDEDAQAARYYRQFKKAREIESIAFYKRRDADELEALTREATK